MKQSQYEPIENLSFQKSNALVSAKYKSSLMENQIMAIALTRIEINAADKNAPIQAKLYPGELKRLLGNDANIYRTLKSVSKTMIGHVMLLEDGKGNFKAFSAVPNADYVDGVFTVEFNKELRQHILGLEKNYTSFELAVMTSFRSNSSFRIYELLKSHLYKSRKSVNDGRVDVEYNVSELRFMIGLANSDDKNVKEATGKRSDNIDWDRLYDKLDPKDRKYDKWGDFQRYVIRPAQKELAEKSNLRFEYEAVKTGRKITRIRFHVYPNDTRDLKKAIEHEAIIEENKARVSFNEKMTLTNRQMELPMDANPDFYDEFVGHNKLTKEDLDYLLSKASFDVNKVCRAIKLADEASKTTGISNYMGWIVSCLTKGWTTVPVVDESAEQGEKIAEILDSYNKADKEELAKKMWNRIKTKDEFPSFVSAIEEYGIELEQLEIVYSYNELTKAFTDWKVGKEINLD